MKKLFFLISALIFPATIGAFDFNYIDFGSPGKGSVSHSEITLSSQTTTTISTSGAQSSSGSAVQLLRVLKITPK